LDSLSGASNKAKIVRNMARTRQNTAETGKFMVKRGRVAGSFDYHPETILRRGRAWKKLLTFFNITKFMYRDGLRGEWLTPPTLQKPRFLFLYSLQWIETLRETVC